ncbi:MAG TPA: 3-hydroxyacyl-CoA dehydrogenase NAD-binding domain-containing protein, partial [Thermodesulfobacteriota bacterium]|nr:3-hydroxyacyl-CoA dehydrogenase NAD-binding domain-containing protein [Thermodesulfobacteriota bacterium]
TLGTQIAIQASYYGYDVSAYDQDPEVFGKMIQKIKGTIKFLGKKPTMGAEAWEKTAAKVTMARDLGEAVKEADLVIEVVPEVLEIKRKVWAQLDSLAPKHALLATNSSSIPVSRIESATKRPEQCMNIHFYMPAVGWTIVDVMGGSKTPPQALETAKQFIRSIECIPLTVKKEILGFCFNSVWRAIKKQTLYLWGEGFVDFRDIDRAWMVMFTPTHGPFFLMDLVGLDVVYDIEMSYYNESKDPRDIPPKALKEKIERKELGVKTGKGFYTYPNPEFGKPEFLKG